MSGKNITFVFGAGAVENSWDPVIRAISNTYGIETNRDGANFLMAKDIYLLRAFSTFAGRDHYPEYFPMIKSRIGKLKQNIASELLRAQEDGEIKSRPTLKEIVDKFANENLDKIAIVSTNWDEVIDLAINKLFRWGKPNLTRNIECYHIHGSISNPEMLYLPSEITMENYRSKIEENKFGNDHRFLTSLLKDNNKTILYGISLDPLDAELNVTLAGGWQSPMNEEIIIINPDHEKVAGRVRLLLDPRTSTKITAYDPSDLHKKVDYG